MPMSEYQQWVQFHAIEPFGPYFDDLRYAQVAAAIYNMNRDTKAHPDPVNPSALVPWNALHRRDAQPNSPQKFDTNQEQEHALLEMISKVTPS